MKWNCLLHAVGFECCYVWCAFMQFEEHFSHLVGVNMKNMVIEMSWHVLIGLEVVIVLCTMNLRLALLFIYVIVFRCRPQNDYEGFRPQTSMSSVLNVCSMELEIATYTPV